MVSALDERPLSSSHTSNWVARNGGLPPRVRGIVRKLMAKGLPESHAIALALHLVKTTAATGRVFGGRYAAHADTKAVHTKAAGQWAALKARAHAHALAGQPSLELAMQRAEARAFVRAIELAVPICSTTDGPQITLTAAQRRAVVKAHLRRRAQQRGALNPEGATK